MKVERERNIKRLVFQGFSPERAKNDSKIAELEEELGLCNEELSTFSEQIEKFVLNMHFSILLQYLNKYSYYIFFIYFKSNSIYFNSLLLFLYLFYFYLFLLIFIYFY